VVLLQILAKPMVVQEVLVFTLEILVMELHVELMQILVRRIFVMEPEIVFILQ